MPKEQVQVNFRMPADLRDRIKAAAEANNRSTTAEIVDALEAKYPPPKKAPQTDEERLLFVLDMIETVDGDTTKTSRERKAHLSVLYGMMLQFMEKLDQDVVDRALDGWVRPPEFADEKFTTAAFYAAAFREAKDTKSE